MTSEQRTFSSSFARTLEENHAPHFQAIFSEQGSEDTPGFRGWEGQDDDAQVSVTRFGERVGEAEGSIANQAERIDSLEVRITSVESTIAQQSAEATATDINVRKLRRQVKKWSGDLDQLRESGTQEVQKAIATAQEAELTVGREVEKAKRETQETTKQIISTEVSRAVNKLRDELLSTISRAAQVSTPMGERSEGQVGADAMAQVLNKIRQVEVRLEVLASTTKEVRKQVTGLKGSNDATVDTRTSTPAQSSASSSNTSQLGNEYGARSLEKMIARIEKFTQEAIREDMDISAVRKRHAVDLPKLQKLRQFFKTVTGVPESRQCR